MKKTLSVLLAGGIAVCLTSAADVKTNAAAGAKITSLSPDDLAQYATLIKEELEAETRMKVFSELAQEHLDRSLEKPSASTAGKAEWEAALGQEFRARMSSVLGELNEVTKQKMEFESDHGLTAVTASVFGSLEEAKTLRPQELAYVRKLDEHSLKVRQELALVEEANQGYYSELQTNTTLEAMGRVSILLDINAKQARQLEWELDDMELRKLEFRALSR